MAPKNKGGRVMEAFVAEHFTKHGPKNPKTKRWFMKCNYCRPEDQPIEHRDLRCLTHSVKVETCPNIPNDARKEGQRILMQKGGIEFTSISSDDESGSPGPATKRAKGSSGKAVVPKGAMESFIDRAMTVEEVDRANVCLLRFFVHGNVPLSASENPYFLKWTHSLRPSYSPATRYVLTERYLPAEEQRAISEDMERLVGRTNLTYLMDGWDDAMRRSVYGCMVAEVGEYPVVLGLHELTGMRGTADTLVEVSNQALARKDIHISAIIAVCTDNPTTMQSFRRKWTLEHPKILVCGLANVLSLILTLP
ncbi:hypothetical protein BDZ94DRAFT_1205972 [Collybia nuda]|uniref:DUF659 domain-containing protein n=1 Tax=Collybia nuda TaxID=64659 RepID=A0A9P5XQU7_9AGAR|nr:hypothetical protein BDZ94DRAFT_1205972 [Collybia nuda]